MPEKLEIKAQVFAQITQLTKDKTLVISDDTPLLGGDSVIDSMRLVELCLALEDKAGEIGFEFDWTSNSAMSRSRSMFRTAGTLAQEFIQQMENQK